MLKNLNKYAQAARASQEDFQEEPLTGDETPAGTPDESAAPSAAADFAAGDDQGTPTEPAGDDGSDIGAEPAPVEDAPAGEAPVDTAPAGEPGMPGTDSTEPVVGAEPAMGSAVPGADLAVGDGIPTADQTIEGDLGGEVGDGGSGEPAVPNGDVVDPEVTTNAEDSDDTFQQMDGGEGNDEATEGAIEAEAATNAKLDDIEEANAALEMYAKQLRQAGLDGFSAQTAAVLHVGLQSCKRRLGISDLKTGLEAYDASPRSALRKATVSLEDIRETMSKGWETFIAWLKKLWELGKQTVNNIKSGITALNLKIKGVQAALDMADGDSPTAGSEPVVVKNAQMLMAGSKLIYPQVGQYLAVASFAADVYPKAVAKYYDEVGAAIKAFNPASGSADDTIERIETKAAPVDNMHASKMSLVGNYEIVAMADGHGWTIEKDGEGSDSEITLPLRDKAKIQETLDKVKAVSEKLEAVYKTQNEIAEAGQSIITAIEDLKKRADSADLDEASKGEASKLATSAFALVRGANPGHKEIVAYVVRGMNTYVAVLAKEAIKLPGATYGRKNAA